MRRKKNVHSKMVNIPTKYKNIQFRSRLEARWACFYDQLKWDWIYEPFDYKGWIPDFLINSKLLIEIKPITDFDKDVDFIQWDTNYTVMLSGVKPISLGTMIITGWDKRGEPYLLKQHNDIFGLSLWCESWNDVFGNINGKQFCYDYDYIQDLFSNAQNETQYKKVECHKEKLNNINGI